MRNRLFRFLIQFVRRVSLPFPFAMVLGFLLLDVTDRILRPDRSKITSGDPGEDIGAALMVVLIVILQAFIGLPSLLLLDRRPRGLRDFLTVALLMSLTFSALLAAMLRAPGLGESFGWMFPRVLVFLGPPLLLSFWMAYLLRPQKAAA